MKVLTTTVVLATSLGAIAQSKINMNSMGYPETKKKEHVDTYFGTSVEDPYRWLEDDRSLETEAWVKTQNAATYKYLDQIPYRSILKERLEKMWNYEKISSPFVEGDYTYYYKNNGLQNQSVLYRKDKQGKEEIFLDPNTFSKDGTTSLAAISFSEDGSKVAYQISIGGSDWREIITIDAKTKKTIDTKLIDVKFGGVSWYKNEGFYYSSYDKPKGSELSAKTDQHKLYYHKLGTKQKNDQVVFGLDKKRLYVGGFVTRDQHYLVITVANSTYGNELYIKDLRKNNSPIVTLVDNFDSDNEVIENKDDVFYITTDYKAPNKRIVTVDLSNPKQENWKDLIKETTDVLASSVGAGYIFTHYMQDAVSMVKQYDFSGNLIRTIKLPGIGSVNGFVGKPKDKILYFSFSNYYTPNNIYSLNPETGETTIYQKTNIDFQSDLYESKQVFYKSKDGTKIPMIITCKKGTKLNGKNPTILYGYGGFNISMTPNFSVSNALWLENGGIYAVANLRGGGEYGKKWHTGGTKLQKQNVFNDFIAAAEYLIKNKFTSSDFLAIRGGSNGGLLVGATMTQRPDLMKVALPAVGVMDMLRYHTFTAGAGWRYDYGTAEDSKEMFEYLKKYSPIHNVKKGVKYPATLVTTGDHDDRVVPAHSFKFVAELQDKQSGTNPTLIRVDINAGHGAGKSVSATINENVDIQAFTLWNMGIKKIN
ncbi:Prolyl endopeptidase precursor [Flavobacterium columnare]|uniref:prolyl oligopeptidase n=2 Tax=Flavobacterium TaxID=237 RepID=A0A2N9PBD9_9FLAO|nr:prolyl oligopeptidase family serine peptidase [Flavobacterium columnare]RVU92145.1 S9 family peptidase [Flavobacterium columnare]SPE77647.1 Prolyl endopeptidase precursor [Flavobacterium columnare]